MTREAQWCAEWLDEWRYKMTSDEYVVAKIKDRANEYCGFYVSLRKRLESPTDNGISCCCKIKKYLKKKGDSKHFGIGFTCDYFTNINFK